MTGLLARPGTRAPDSGALAVAGELQELRTAGAIEIRQVRDGS